MPSLPSFHRTDRAGLPVYWAETPPPFTASLAFRVGRADESLSTAGITHMLEHLALFAVGTPPFEIGGFVDNSRTVLSVEGSRSEAFEFLGSVSSAIREPQLERLDRERQVLITEAEQWSPNIGQVLMSLRFGAISHGLAGYPEYGLHRVDEDDVVAWAAERFTHGNAAVWMTGPVPPDFEIELPGGPRASPPALNTLPGLDLPAYLAQGEGGVAVSLVGKRSTTLRSALMIAAERAHQRLRMDAGLSYEIAEDYEPLGADVVHLTIGADCQERHALTVRNELLQVLAELASEGPTQEELANHVEQARRAMEDTRSVPGELDVATANELLGAPVPTRAELLAEIQGLTAEAIATALDEVSGSALVLAPEDVPHPDSGYSVYDPWNREQPVAGRTYHLSLASRLPPLRKRSDRLICAPDGISVETAEGETLTIRLTDIVGVIVRADRSVEIVGKDGSSVEIDLEHTPKGHEILADIRAHVSPDLIVPMEDWVLAWLAIEEVASRKLKRRWVVSDELVALAERLPGDETLLNLAEANRGLKGGLLAVTDRRLVFLYEGIRKKEALELPHQTLGAIEGRSGRRLISSSEIAVTASGERIEFKDISPRERIPEIVAEVRARLPD